LKAQERRKTAQFRQLWTVQFSSSRDVRRWPQLLLRPDSLQPSEEAADRAPAPVQTLAAAPTS
jgi:hypothetical protein